MPTPQPWVITQIGGRGKRIELTGLSAPHGRQRQKPIVTPEMSLRESETYYPGNSSGPTRHVFGYKFADWELSGRFEDRGLGAGGARAKVRQIERFIADGLPCTIAWGSYLHFRGLLKAIVPGIESDAHVAWTLKFAIDADLDLKSLEAGLGGTRITVADHAAEILARTDALKGLANPPGELEDQLSVDFLDAIEGFVASLTSATASVLAITDQIGSLESALAGDIKRLQAGLHQLNTAAIGLQETISTAEQDAVLIRRNAETDDAWSAFRLQAAVDGTASLAAIADLKRQTEIAQRGKTSTTYQAQGGDTWESISNDVYGSPDRADAIRQANGIRFGEKPIAGATYQIPA